MKRVVVVMAAMLALPMFAAAEDWSNVAMIDYAVFDEGESESGCPYEVVRAGVREERIRDCGQGRELSEVRCEGKPGGEKPAGEQQQGGSYSRECVGEERGNVIQVQSVKMM